MELLLRPFASRKYCRAITKRLREAHETRVASAAAELEAVRRRDAGDTAHALNTAEAGVAAALDEASSAVEAARKETREAAAAFSVTLMLRAWWMHVRHAGEVFRESAVESLRAPRRRGLIREVLLTWSQAGTAYSTPTRLSPSSLSLPLFLSYASTCSISRKRPLAHLTKRGASVSPTTV